MQKCTYILNSEHFRSQDGIFSLQPHMFRLCEHWTTEKYDFTILFNEKKSDYTTSITALFLESS